MMILTHAAKLRFKTSKTSISTQKIDVSPLKTYEIALAKFLFGDSLGKVWFSREIFLLANTSMEVVLEMLFLYLINVNVKFV